MNEIAETMIGKRRRKNDETRIYKNGFKKFLNLNADVSCNKLVTKIIKLLSVSMKSLKIF